MKTIPMALTLCFVAFFAACILSGESTFYSNFSVRQLIKKHEADTGLVCDPKGGGGGGDNGGHVGSYGRGGSHFSASKADTFNCRLSSEAVARFDDAGLLAALKVDVEKALNDSGAKITESGPPDRASFYFKYTIQNIQGRVKMSGRRFGNDYYDVSAELEESK